MEAQTNTQAPVAQAQAQEQVPPQGEANIQQTVVINTRPKAKDGTITSVNTFHPTVWAEGAFADANFVKELAEWAFEKAWIKKFKDAKDKTRSFDIMATKKLILDNLVNAGNRATFAVKLVGDDWKKFADNVVATLPEATASVHGESIGAIIGARKLPVRDMAEKRLKTFTDIFKYVQGTSQDTWTVDACAFALDKVEKRVKQMAEEQAGSELDSIALAIG